MNKKKKTPYTPYYTAPNHTTPGYTTLYHTAPRHTDTEGRPRNGPYHSKPYHSKPYHSKPYHSKPYHSILYRSTPYQYGGRPEMAHTSPSYTAPGHATPSHESHPRTLLVTRPEMALELEALLLPPLLLHRRPRKRCSRDARYPPSFFASFIINPMSILERIVAERFEIIPHLNLFKRPSRFDQIHNIN